MHKYEAMFIVRPDLSEEERKNLFNQIKDVVTKNNGQVTSGDIWSEKRKLIFALKKYREGIYYLMNFNVLPTAVKEIRHMYKLNEDILRVLVTRIG